MIGTLRVPGVPTRHVELDVRTCFSFVPFCDVWFYVYFLSISFNRCYFTQLPRRLRKRRGFDRPGKAYHTWAQRNGNYGVLWWRAFLRLSAHGRPTQSNRIRHNFGLNADSRPYFQMCLSLLTSMTNCRVHAALESMFVKSRPIQNYNIEVI